MVAMSVGAEPKEEKDEVSAEQPLVMRILATCSKQGRLKGYDFYAREGLLAE